MMLKQPGPAQDGFHVLVHDLNEKVHIEFGVLVNHIPMSKDAAQELAGAVFRVWRKIDPLGKMLLPVPGVTITKHEGQVLLEMAVEVSELVLSSSESRTFCLQIMDAIANLEGKPFLLGGV